MIYAILAAIQEVEPTAIPLVAIMLSSVAMYAIGILLPCGRCCQEESPCDLCESGEIPDTLTITIDEFPSPIHGDDLTQLIVTSSCFGEGFSGRVTAPFGKAGEANGPITQVEVTNPGSGYAKRGRVAPTVTVSGGSGTGATFNATLNSTTTTACLVPQWAISSVSGTGGTGYVDLEPLTLTVAGGDTVEQAAVVRVLTNRAQPTLTAGSPGGSGASITIGYIETTDSATGRPGWMIGTLTIENGGSGYTDGAPLEFALGTNDSMIRPPSATISTGRVQPTLAASVVSPGSGAVLAVTPFQTTDLALNLPVWRVSTIGITTPGTGYSVDDPVAVSATDGQSTNVFGGYFEAYVSEVNASGGIVAIDIWNNGGFFKGTGVIAKITIPVRGLYYKSAGDVIGVEVVSGGVMYREDNSVPPYVSNVTVQILNFAPSDGSFATLVPVVDDDPESPTFGEITSVTISNPGNGYLAYEVRGAECCGDFYEGLSFVVKRGRNQEASGYEWGYRGACNYWHYHCSVGNLTGGPGRVLVTYQGADQPLLVELTSELGINGQVSRICNVTLSAPGFDACDEIDGKVVTSRDGLVSATITAGGEYDVGLLNPGLMVDDQIHTPKNPSCNPCCKGSDAIPSEVTASISGLADFGRPDGDYVLTFVPYGAYIQGDGWLDFNWFNALYWAKTDVIQIYYQPCSTQYIDEWSDYQNPGSIGGGWVDCPSQCHNACFPVMNIKLPGLPPPDGNVELIDGGGLERPTCGGCEETPICSPVGRTYTVDATEYLSPGGPVRRQATGTVEFIA